MNPNDETIYQAPKKQDGYENEEMIEEVVNETDDKNTSPKSEKSNGWAKMTIGGVTGVFMGAAGMYVGKPFLDDAAFGEGNTLADWLEDHGIDAPDWLRPGVKPVQPIAGGAKPEGGNPDGEPMPQDGHATKVPPTGAATHTGEGFAHTTQVHEDITIPPIGGPLQVAHVDQSLSFADAFAQARAEVGPGGVFHWHGGVFNTYTEAEWDSMSASDKSDFAQHVAPEVHHRPESDLAQNYGPQQDPEQASPLEDGDDTIVDPDPEEDALIYDVNIGVDEEPEYDVHFLGVQHIENEDGSQMNIGYATIDSGNVALVDLDGDEVFDVRVSDDNKNGEIERNEVTDISDANITIDDFSDYAIAQGNSEDGSYDPNQPLMPQDDLAQGTPDYVNDADVSDGFMA